MTHSSSDDVTDGELTVAKPKQQQRNRRSTSFAITLSGDVKCQLGRSWTTSRDLSGWCVARERYHECDTLDELCDTEGDATGKFHVHAYARFGHQAAKLLPDARAWVLDCLKVADAPDFDGSINIQTCKNERQWIRYITKEDEEPLWRGIDFGYLSVRAQVCYHARRGVPPTSAHPVVALHYNQRNQVLAMWSEFYVS
jgi:hypothetical protein